MAEKRKRTQFSPAALEYRRRILAQAPPLTPEQQAIIRGACAKPYPPPKKADKAA